MSSKNKRRNVSRRFQPTSFHEGMQEYPLSIPELQQIYFPTLIPHTGTNVSSNTISSLSCNTDENDIGGLSSSTSTSTIKLFPLPDVRKGDDLDIDSDYPPQSFREYRDDENRSLINPLVQKIYIIGIGWEDQTSLSGSSEENKGTSTTGIVGAPFSPFPVNSTVSYSHLPRLEDIVQYIKVFYYGIDVELCSASLHFIPWTTTTKVKPRVIRKSKKSTASSSSSLRYIGATDGTNVTRIRCRTSLDHLYPYQINLNDTLDCLSDYLAINNVYDTTVAIMGITPYDLYEMDKDDDDYDEEEEDLFTCGRAYGGSKISVISAARYNPYWDKKYSRNSSSNNPHKKSKSSTTDTVPSYTSGIDIWHTWPLGSNAPSFIETAVQEEFPSTFNNKATTSSSATTTSTSAEEDGNLSIPSSFSVNSDIVPGTSYTLSLFQKLWYARICKTSVHELGHCLILDHCCYFSCTMQGSAHLMEDMRQPPYLCPICLSKIVYGIHYEHHQHTSGKKNKEEESLKDTSNHHHNHPRRKDTVDGNILSVPRIDTVPPSSSLPTRGVSPPYSLISTYVQQRYIALYNFCTNFALAQKNPMFYGYQLWLKSRLNELNVNVREEGSKL